MITGRFSFPVLLVILNLSATIAVDDDVKCLQGIKGSLADPLGKLAAWTFSTNTSAAFFCQLAGVTCWNDNSTRVLSLELSNTSLAGRIPESLKYCASLQSLYLASNDLVGPIPPDICTWLPYLVTLRLPGNQLSGSIPPGMANCTFLSVLDLGDNKLSGAIPDELARLQRLQRLSVANNDLSGMIPSDLSKYDAESFSGNKGLCGYQLNKLCKKSTNTRIIIIAGVLGAVGSLFLSFTLYWWFSRRSHRK